MIFSAFEFGTVIVSTVEVLPSSFALFFRAYETPSVTSLPAASLTERVPLVKLAAALIVSVRVSVSASPIVWAFGFTLMV